MISAIALPTFETLKKQSGNVLNNETLNEIKQ